MADEDRAGFGHSDLALDLPEQVLARFALAGDAGLWRRWTQLVELDDASSGSHDLLPSAYLRLEAQRGVDEVGSGDENSDLGRLRGLYRQRWVLRQRHVAAAERAMAVLEESGIEHLGPSDQEVAASVDEPLVFPLRVPRLTVRDDGLRTALSALTEAGWRPNGAGEPRSVRRRLAQTEWRLVHDETGSELVVTVAFIAETNDPAFSLGVWERAKSTGRRRRRPAPTDLLIAVLSEDARDRGSCRWAVGATALARQGDFAHDTPVFGEPAIRHLLPTIVARLEFLASVEPDRPCLDRMLRSARIADAAASRRRPPGRVARQWLHRSRQARVLIAGIRRRGGIRGVVTVVACRPALARRRRMRRGGSAWRATRRSSADR